MKNKSKLGRQFLLGYGIVLALIVLISMTSYTGLNSAVSQFNEYRELARNSNLSSRIQANMLLVRLNVKDYILSKSPEAIEQYQERYNNLQTYLDIADEQMTGDENRALIYGITAQVLQYDDGFNDVINLMKQRDDVVHSRLDTHGLAMRKAVTDIMASAFKSGDAEAAYYAGVLQEALLLGRLYAAKFLTTNAATDKERAMKELSDNMVSRAADLDKSLQNPARRAMLERFDDAFEKYRSAFEDTAQIIDSRNDIIKNTLDAIGPKVADEAENIKLSIQKRQDIIGPEVKTNNESTVERVLSLSIASLLIGILSAVFLLAVIKKSLAALGGEPVEMEKIASRIADGDLTTEFNDPATSSGVYAAMRHMVENLKSIVTNVNGTAAELYGGAAEISRGNSELFSRTEHQAASLQNAASSMEQITVIVKNNADNAKVASKLATEACSQAEAGGNVVNKAVDAMTDINDSSRKIANIISVIDEIAFQTNLLALNAAVEAARAGEQGRGFAVVAGEVRVLAQRSAEAAREISELINDSVSKVKDGASLVDDSGKTLSEIVTSVKQVSTIITDISLASSEQSLGIQEIDRVIRDVDDITQKNAQLVENAARNSSKLEDQASVLSELMTQFKLAEGQLSDKDKSLAS